MTDYYVYAHRALSRRDRGEIFYIGKGRGKRAWSKDGRNPHWRAVVAKYGYAVEMVMDGLTEAQAFELEKSLIVISGREVLCNLTAGGDGVSGLRWSRASKSKQSSSKMGNTNGKGNAGKTASESTKAK